VSLPAVCRDTVSHTEGTEASTQAAGDWPLPGQRSDTTQRPEYSAPWWQTRQHVDALWPEWPAVRVQGHLGQSGPGGEDTLGLLLLANVSFTFILEFHFHNKMRNLSITLKRFFTKTFQF